MQYYVEGYDIDKRYYIDIEDEADLSRIRSIRVSTDIDVTHLYKVEKQYLEEIESLRVLRSLSGDNSFKNGSVQIYGYNNNICMIYCSDTNNLENMELAYTTIIQFLNKLEI